MIDPSFSDLFTLSPWVKWLLALPLVGWYHLVQGRTRGLKAGSASADEQRATLLNTTPHLDHQGTANIETTLHRDSTINNGVFNIKQHDIGRPPEKTWCSPNRKQNRTQKGFALIVGKPGERPETADEAGDVHMLGDLQVKRYIMGAYRWGVATAASVAGTAATAEENEIPPTVEAIDEEFECQISGGIQISGAGLEDPGIEEGDRIAYVIDYDGIPVTWGGGGGATRPLVGTALANIRQVGQQWTATPGYQASIIRNNATLANHTVRFAHTSYGQSVNVEAGATVIYQRAEDGNYWALGSYTDNPVGTVLGNGVTETIWAPDAWQRHTVSRGRTLPHYGLPPFPDFLGTGGQISHNHADHDLGCLMTEITVVTDVEANFETCLVTSCFTDICILGLPGQEGCE